jgi:hypothetical protein
MTGRSPLSAGADPRFRGNVLDPAEVRVPYSVIYDLRGDQISALRIYFPMNLLIEQLTR